MQRSKQLTGNVLKGENLTAHTVDPHLLVTTSQFKNEIGVFIPQDAQCETLPSPLPSNM